MKFHDVQSVFFRNFPRKYHRHARELFGQLMCLHANLKPAYLFDLFPCSIEAMRNLLDDLTVHLPFQSMILKYSLNDLVILNRSHLPKLIDTSTSVLLVDLNTMTTTEHQPMLDEIRRHLSWIDARKDQRTDFDSETDGEWCKLIQRLNHTTVFGYILGYPVIYYYASTTLTNVTTLKNFRLYVQINEFDDELLLYSFSYPVHVDIDERRIDSVVNTWFSSLSVRMDATALIKSYHLEQQTREQATWCL